VSLAIRDAVVDDALGIARVHVAGWQAGYAGLLPQQYLDQLSVEQRAQRWAAILGEPDDRSLGTLVADVDGHIAGWATVGGSRDDDAQPGTGELWGIYADPAHWGRGVGHALHVAAVEVLRAAGRKDATLWVLDGNTRAIRFYERQGWVADGATKTDWRDDVRLDELRYRLDVETS
jgi:ribosomal protein S18 acetylase RimI-like enzyme